MDFFTLPVDVGEGFLRSSRPFHTRIHMLRAGVEQWQAMKGELSSRRKSPENVDNSVLAGFGPPSC